MRILTLFLTICISSIAFAQTDSTSVIKLITATDSTAGKITIIQDSQIDELIERHIQINTDNESKIEGWRIQIYNSTGQETRKEANDVRNRFLAKYPDEQAYVIYQPPIFKIRVGNFRTREEAFALYKLVLQEFPVAYLVRDKIVLPKLPTIVETDTIE